MSACMDSEARGAVAATHEAFVRELLSGVDGPTLPYGMASGGPAGGAFAAASRDVDAALARRLHANALSDGLWLAAWAQVVARVSGRDDVVFGLRCANLATLPVRLRIDETAVRDGIVQAAALAAELQQRGAMLAHGEEFHAVLALPSGAAPIASADGCPMTLTVVEAGGITTLCARVRKPIHARQVCELMHRALQQLVQALEQSPTTPLRTLDVLPEAERRQLLVEWNATQAEYPSQACIHELIEAQVLRTPDAPAVVGVHTLTYAELNAQANRLARHLRRLGVRPDTRVGVCMRRDEQMVVALLAILKAGGAYVALDPDYPAQRLAHIVADSAPVAVLVRGEVPL
ncbi:MAG TPA: AMP-binding protein, partial [Albitalea sp.]